MKEWYYKHKETVNYIFWCVMTTAVSWLAFSIYSYLLGLIEAIPVSVSVLIANTLSWITAVTFSFVANKIRVFESKSWNPKVVVPQILKFFSTRAAVGVLEILSVPLMVSLGLDRPIFGVDGLLSKIITTPIVILLNYLCTKFIVFTKKNR